MQTSRQAWVYLGRCATESVPHPFSSHRHPPQMISLADYTSPELLLPNLQSENHSHVLKELCGRMEHAGRVQNAAFFYDAVLRREQLSSTVTSGGWAMPHARMPNLSGLTFALGLLPEPIPWFESGVAVSMVFLSAVPNDEISNYLKFISGLVKLSRDSMWVSRLLHAGDSQVMLQLLRQIPSEQQRAAIARS